MLECTMKDYLESKVHSNSGSVMVGEELVNISLDETGLATTQLSNNQHFEDIFCSGCRMSTHGDTVLHIKTIALH